MPGITHAISTSQRTGVAAVEHYIAPIEATSATVVGLVLLGVVLPAIWSRKSSRRIDARIVLGMLLEAFGRKPRR